MVRRKISDAASIRNSLKLKWSSEANTKNCRSEPARDSGLSVTNQSTDTPLSRAGSLLHRVPCLAYFLWCSTNCP
ncbi:hypothetical protein C1893_08550 [Pseudomonas sp. MPR-ANC1]|nr:hypothetical protein C1893_08550 [Pseudomonas sp. MPR-ANC1]